MALSKYDIDHGGENKIVAAADFDGPVKTRKITDPLFALILLCTWGGCIYLGYWAIQNGDPYKIINPTDYKGRVCGVDKDENGTLLPIKWHAVDALMNGVCVASCPQKNVFNPTNRSQLVCKDDADIVKIKGCTGGDISNIFTATEEASSSGMNGNVTISSNPAVLVICGACMYEMDTFSTLDYCLPDSFQAVITHINDVAEQVVGGALNNSSGSPLTSNTVANEYIPVLERFARDLVTARDVIFGIGFGGSAFLGFLCLFLLRFPYLVASVVWTASLAVPCLFGTGGYFFYSLAGEYELVDSTSQNDGSGSIHGENKIFAVRIMSFVLMGLAGFIALTLVFMRKRINLAVAITRAAASSVVGVPFSVFYPLLQIVGYAALLFPWATFVLHLASIGEPTSKTTELFGAFDVSYTVFEYSDFVVYTFWFMVFVLFWTSEFIVAMGQITLSICFSKWYFTIEKNLSSQVSVLGTTCVTFCKHFGTAAFGSLLIATIQWVRAILLWFQKKLKQTGMDNAITKAFMCCCQCCLYCLERFMKFVSKNAYVQTAIFGYSFCKAAQESFFLILRNAARTAAVGLVSELSMIFCKLFVMAGTSVGSYVALHEIYGNELFSITAVTGFITVIAWFVADMFVEVLGIAVVTILQCFLADEEMFPDGSYYVPKELDDFLEQLDAYDEY